MNTPRSNAPRRCPAGITLIVVLTALGSILTIIYTLLPPVHVHAGTTLPAPLSLLFAGIDLVLVYGLWMLKRWAFWGLVIVEAVSILINIVGIPSTTNILSHSVALVFPVLSLLYLFANRTVRAAFRT
ncbi:MAG: hypothetical protein PVS3B3_32840 [Ktedonobacteraceae bacterium]